MTDFDKKLIEKANGFRRWDYSHLVTLKKIADTDEARQELKKISDELFALVHY